MTERKPSWVADQATPRPWLPSVAGEPWQVLQRADSVARQLAVEGPGHTERARREELGDGAAAGDRPGVPVDNPPARAARSMNRDRSRTIGAARMLSLQRKSTLICMG